ncbi:hypothetical protein DVS77_04665 [Mycolicibacterium moriokaense]|nr:hypothetical protein DVS77_04665 [Mycolicibacterium moriokaense]
MDYRITPEDRIRFKRCRRQWDFASPNRRDLEPNQADESSILPRAFVDAMAVYYYPGTWDWQHDLKQSLVHKSLRRSLQYAERLHDLERLTAQVDLYDAWARTVDDFAPVKIGHDVTALVHDPADKDTGLVTSDGAGVTYACRVDLLAVDAADEYWVVRHLIVEDWRSLDELVLDEEAIAACWAWQQDYIGMEVAGSIHNEVRLDGPIGEPAGADAVRPVAQHEASGGGRSIPQHVRAAARESRPVAERIEQHTAGMLRRTRIRRGPGELAAAAGLLATEAIEMSATPTVYPSPGQHCCSCAFSAPCLSMFAGEDPQPMLTRQFHRRGQPEDRPRLGQATWGFGRGAAPPGW